MIHNEAVLLALNAKYWELKPGKYSYEDDPDKGYDVCYNPLAFGYCALQDTEYLFSSRLSTEVKVGLIKHLANIYHGLLQWQSGQRGRKIGIEADLTRGGIAHNQDSKLTLGIEYYRRSEDSLTGGRLELFIIVAKGVGNVQGHMPIEHMVTINAAGAVHLGYCLSNGQIPNDMSDIFNSIY